MSKKIITALSFSAIIVIGIISAVVLVRQRQELSKKASTQYGVVTVSLSPETGDYVVGDTIPLQIYFNPNSTTISGVAVRVFYNLANGDISATTPVINSDLLSSGQWSCPVNKISSENNSIYIDIACLNISTGGFNTSTDTLLATIDLSINSAPTNNSLTLSFDQSLSMATNKSTGSDNLLTPTNIAQYNLYDEVVVIDDPDLPSPDPTSPPQNISYKITDLNQDGKINNSDYVILFNNFRLRTLLNSRADINNDNVVNLLDYTLLFEDYSDL